MGLNIWRFTDDKPGHDSQSMGLSIALEKYKICHRVDLPAEPLVNNIANLLFNRFPKGKGLPHPDIIIGAGHRTHFPMLSARRAYGGKIIVLMGPSLPFSFFDLCIIPEHDIPPERSNVITTIGALNPIQFNKAKSPNTGLMLLGGHSKHGQWDNDLIINQIKEIISAHTEIQWRIANSIRTPKELLPIINALDFKNVAILPCDKTDTKKLHSLIFMAEPIWISSDSISMIYESLSSGARVGLLEVPRKKEDRLSTLIKELISDEQLTTFNAWQKTKTLKPNTIKLNEAARCALLLLENGFLN